jgi:hypothetical protein
MTDPRRLPAPPPFDRCTRMAVAGLVAVLLGTAVAFRLIRLSWVPGVSGDEAWWGMQALAWLAGRPYEARTTSGNPIDPFFLVPLGLLHGIAPPSIVLLRLVPVAANLLALPIGFWFVRRMYGRTTAWVHTVGLAILPTALVHSRICQDPSQSVLWSGLVVYLSLLGHVDRGKAWTCLGAALLVFPVAFWTHPTNVFVAPFLLLPFAAAVGPVLPASRLHRVQIALAAACLVLAFLWLARPVVGQLTASNESLRPPWLSLAGARLVDGRQWVELAANTIRLLNGVTVYHYFSGARPTTWPYDLGVVIVAGVAASGLFVPAAARHGRRDLGLLAACAGTWILFFAFAGPGGLRPHFERWGLCLLVPAMLVLAGGLGSWIDDRGRLRGVKIAAAGLIASGVLVSFQANYFREFATTGGRSHLTYITAPIEPKHQVLAHVLDRSPEGRAVIIADAWWLYWPLAYLATPHPRVTVLRTGLNGVSAGRAHDVAYFVVEFAGTPALDAKRDWLRNRAHQWTETTIHDAGGRPLIEILEVEAASRSAASGR